MSQNFPFFRRHNIKFIPLEIIQFIKWVHKISKKIILKCCRLFLNDFAHKLPTCFKCSNLPFYTDLSILFVPLFLVGFSLNGLFVPFPLILSELKTFGFWINPMKEHLYFWLNYTIKHIAPVMFSSLQKCRLIFHVAFIQISDVNKKKLWIFNDKYCLSSFNILTVTHID